MKMQFSRLEFLGGLGALAALGCGSWHCGGDGLRVASWNIGHFALGKGPDPTIPPTVAVAQAHEYRRFLAEVDADFVGVCEYSEAVASNGTVMAASTVFGDYPHCAVGPKHEYQHNAQFWRRLESRGKSKVVDYSKHLQGTYYLATRLMVGGKEVTFVETHLDWGTIFSGHEGDRVAQMQQLIDDFATTERVVIAGDFNVGIRDRERKRPTIDNPAEYEVFRAAGYELGNDGRYKTHPAGKGTCALDNIIVKGMRIADFTIYDRPDLSDHALIAATIF